MKIFAYSHISTQERRIFEILIVEIDVKKKNIRFVSSRIRSRGSLIFTFASESLSANKRFAVNNYRFAQIESRGNREGKKPN